MQVTRQDIEPCTISLKIQVDEEAVAKGFDRAYREYAKVTKVPGFRPGKAPRKILEQFVDKEAVCERAAQLVAGPAYREALEQEKVSPYDDPEVTGDNIEEGKAWEFTVEVPLAPVVTLGDYKDLTIERPVYQITDSDIDAQVERIREEYARVTPVSDDRGVQEKDILIADVTITLESDETPQEPRRSLIRVGDNIPGFDEQIMGMKPDEERTFEIAYPEDFQQTERAGKKATFTVKLASINERVLPDVTDEWISGVLPFSTVDEWRSDIRTHAEARAHEMCDNVAESRIVDELIKRSTIEFPRVMAAAEVHNELHRLGHALEEQGATYEQFLEANKLTQEQHTEKLQEQAANKIRTRLVLRELAQAENLGVSDEDIENEFASLLEGYDTHDQSVRRIVRSEERRHDVANMVIQRKLHECLFHIATIKDTPEKPAE